MIKENTETMKTELIETTPELASEILAKGNRKITIGSGRLVRWINLNNQTCFAGKNGSGCTYNNEDITFFISVPKGAKTVY